MTRAYWLALLLQKLGHAVQIIGTLAPGEEIYPRPPQGLAVVAVTEPDFPRQVRKLLKSLDGDLVYAIKPRPTSFGVALIQRLTGCRPIILDIDDWELSFCRRSAKPLAACSSRLNAPLAAVVDGVRRIRAQLSIGLLERLVKRADAVTVNTRFLQRRYGGTYLPSGKDTQLFDPMRFDPQQTRACYGLSPYRVVMFPGTPAPHKGLEDVLIALDMLAQPDLRLVLVGGRKEADGYVEELLQRWNRWIIRLPRFPVGTMPRLVSAADVVVVAQRDVPAARAQCPMKLTDAMAMAKPTVCTRVGDVPAIVGDTAYLVAPFSPVEIAEALTTIFRNPKRARLRGISARERCIACYSLDAIAPVLADVLTRFEPRASTASRERAYVSTL